MKKLFSFLFLLLISMAVFAQKDVTKFLGIPVDGTKAAMQQKLVAKGFVYNKLRDCLTGEFNGAQVRLHIVTNNNKVYRILVEDANTVGETSIRIRFNKLCSQFERNEKYVPTNLGMEDYTIDEKEDIGYEMLVNKKRYEASYYQVPESVDTAAVQALLLKELSKVYTNEQLENPTEEIAADIQVRSAKLAFELFSKKSVWFMIDSSLVEYRILMFYDNEYNHADGEDL